MANPETKRFGRYEVVGQLGRGAMGIVYKARDPQIDRLVALKTVPLRGQEPDEEKEFRWRFLNEAQAAGRLHHPGIVSVFDVGEDPESRDPYIVLEYVAGEALSRVLAREKKLPLARALQIAAEIADALDCAHLQGVIHRDIKPGNILITPDGHPKIADFGIAKLNLAHLTVPGKVLGTPAYMAPEQLSGEKIDGRSDLFSLGVILYAMVVGKSPFQGDNASTVCFKVANREPVPASAVDLSLPRELDAVIARAMAKDPRKRYQRGKDFAADLRKLRAKCKPSAAAAVAPALAAAGALKAAPSLSGRPAVGLAYAAKFVRATILKAPVRDLILGVATVIMLAIVGVQSKLLVGTHQEAANPAGTQQTATSETQPAPVPQTTVSVTPANHDQPSAAKARRANSKAVLSTKPATSRKPTLHKASANAAAVPPMVLAKKNADPSPHPAMPVVIPLSMVEVSVRHQFKDATLTVFVDDKSALTLPLHGATQKRLVLFNGVRGIESETLKMPAGKHVLRFQVQTADQMIDLSKTISGDFIGGDDKTLQITFDKHNSAMHLDWQ